MLTKEILEKMPANHIFANGEMLDTEEQLFMANTGKMLRWVAVRGGIADWAIYCHFANKSVEWISRQGDKVCMERHIKLCVPCDDEAFALYRF